jgi:tetratricopeptide (TPR) repeat protein
MLKEKQCPRVTALHLTTKFNLAHCYENTDKVDEAVEIYSSIIIQEPTYTDAYLRLAYISRSKGDFKKALDYVD